MVAKYGKTAQNEVKNEMDRYKKGTAHSGTKKSNKVKSREQAIAIGLSKARKKALRYLKKRLKDNPKFASRNRSESN